MFFKEKKNYLVEYKWDYGCREKRETVQAKSKNEAISKVLQKFPDGCEVLSVVEVKFF